MLVLFGIGMLLGLAASPPLAEQNGLPHFYYVARQAQFGAAGAGRDVRHLDDVAQLVRRLGVLGFVLALLALVLLPVFGTDFGKGAIRWYSFGFASFQPSEFLKPGFVVVTAWLMAASYDLNGPPGRLYSFVLMLVIVGFLAMQPDFGQAALVLFGWGGDVFRRRGADRCCCGLAGVVAFTGTLRLRAFRAFRAPDRRLPVRRCRSAHADRLCDQRDHGGRLLRRRRRRGQVKWSLPDAHTDFIIAVAAEEYGLVLVLLIIALYATIMVRSLMRLVRERDPFIRLAGTGLACIFGVQAMINMGVAVRLLPAKGMTLPFVSYGGSSLIAGGIAVGMLLAFTRSRPQGGIEDILGRRG